MCFIDLWKSLYYLSITNNVIAREVPRESYLLRRDLSRCQEWTQES